MLPLKKLVKRDPERMFTRMLWEVFHFDYSHITWSLKTAYEGAGCFSFTQAPWTLGSNSASQAWPTEAAIEFRNYGVQYRPNLEFALKNINIKINGQEKVSKAIYFFGAASVNSALQ